ncbi:MAG: 50S ribosomal protein L11 methyltransferase [Kosmotogaceae bacterium]
MRKNYLHFIFRIDQTEIDLLQEKSYIEGFNNIFFQSYDNNKWIAHVYIKKGENIPVFLADRPLTFLEIENTRLWTKNWKENLKPFELIDGVRVIPMQEPKKIHSSKKIGIVPGLSFGTGLHETTKICAEFIHEFLQKNDRVLDIGTGTGILSVLAMQFGAGYALAVDNDELALSKCKETAWINNVKIDIAYSDFLSGIDSNQTFDLVVSNMIADPLLSYYKNVVTLMKEKSLFIISGILKNQQHLFMRSDTPYRIIKTKEKDEWTGFALKKK